MAETAIDPTLEVVQSDEHDHAVAHPAPFAIHVTLLSGQRITLMALPTTVLDDLIIQLVNEPIFLIETCVKFELANGTVLPRGIPLGSIDGFGADASILVKPEVYTEFEVRAHLQIIQDQILANTADTTAAPSYLFDRISGTARATDNNAAPHAVPRHAFEPEADSSTSLKLFFPAHHVTPAERFISSVSLSTWNPVPAHRKLLGDLAYLTAVTQEGLTLHITATAAGFFRNLSTDDLFDPLPHSRPFASHSLASVLGQASPVFKANYPLFKRLLVAAEAANLRQQQLQQHQHQQQQQQQQQQQATEANASETVPAAETAPKTSEAAADAAPAPQPVNVLELLSKSSVTVYEAAPMAFPRHTFITPTFARHKSDALRAEKFSMGARAEMPSALPGQLRDWNEEWQVQATTPVETADERLARDAALNDLYNDFVGAAIRGAQEIVSGNIPAVNPGGAREQQLYIYNNIFFCFPDSTRELFNQNSAAVHAAAALDIKSISVLRHLLPEKLHQLLAVVIDFRGFRVSAQALLPGIFRRDGTPFLRQGFDPNGTMYNYNEEYSDLFGKVAEHLRLKPHAIPSGKILKQVETAIAAADPEHAAAEPASAEKENETHQTVLAADVRGVFGADNRMYMIETQRLTPVDVNFMPELTPLPAPGSTIPSDPTVYVPKKEHELCLLRRELLERHLKQQANDAWRAMMAEEIAAKKAKTATEGEAAAADAVAAAAEKTPEEQAEEAAAEAAREAKFAANMEALVETARVNVDTFTRFGDLATDEEKAQVRALGAFANACTLRLADEFVRSDNRTSFPVDGDALTQLMHSNGLNMRYLGAALNHIMTMHQKASASHFAKKLIASEMIARVAKRMLRHRLSNSQNHAVADAVASFFNALFDAPVATAASSCVFPDATALILQGEAAQQQDGKANAGKKKSKPNKPNKAALVVSLPVATAELQAPSALSNLWAAIFDEVKQHFRFDFAAHLAKNAAPSFAAVSAAFGIELVPLLRAVCVKTGIQLSARDYLIESGKPVLSAADVRDVYPLVKRIDMQNPDVRQLVYDASQQLHSDDGDINTAIEMFMQALLHTEQTQGVVTTTSMTILQHISACYERLGEDAATLQFAKHAVIVAERAAGLDSSLILEQYLQFAMLCEAMEDNVMALKFLQRGRYLVFVLFGRDHPVLSRIDLAIYRCLAALGDVNRAARFAESALKHALPHFAADSNRVLELRSHLASALFLADNLKKAIEMEREVLKICETKFGKDAADTVFHRDQLAQMQALSAAKISVSQIQAQAQAQALAARTARAAPAVAATPAPARASSKKQNLNMDDIDSLVRFIDGGKKSNKKH